MKTAAKIASFYWHGFRSMQTGRTLWLIIIFGFLRLAFCPDLLNSKFETDAQRAAYVLDNITVAPDTKEKGP